MTPTASFAQLDKEEKNVLRIIYLWIGLVWDVFMDFRLCFVCCPLQSIIDGNTQIMFRN